MSSVASNGDLDDDAVEEVSGEFRARLSTFQPITRERKQTLLNETTILQPVLESNTSQQGQVFATGSDKTDDVNKNSQEHGSVAEINDEPLQYKIPRLTPLQATCTEGDGDKSGALVVQFWQGLPHVKQSGILKKFDAEQIAMNEAMFEIIKASKSYYKSLCVILDHFKIKFEEKFGSRFKYVCQQLFLNIPTLASVTDRLINRLEEVQADNVEMQPECIAVVKYFAENFFEEPYVKYCSKQDQQNIALAEIERNKEMSTYLAMLERDPVCQMLPLSAFLLLPMQMLTRWPILLLAVQKHGERIPLLHFAVKNTIKQVEKLALTCNSYRERLAHEQKLIQIEKSIDFPKSFRYSLTAEKSKTKLFYDGTFQVVWLNIPGVYKSKSFRQTLKIRSNINDSRLITFDDGSVLILQVDGKDSFKFVNYSPVWSVLSDRAQLEVNVGDKLRRYLRLSKEYGLALVILRNGVLPQPNKLLFLFKKNAVESQAKLTSLLQCAGKSPPLPRSDDQQKDFNVIGNGTKTNEEEIPELESPSSRFSKALKWAKSTETLNVRPETSSFSHMHPHRRMILSKPFGSLDGLDASDDEIREEGSLSSEGETKTERASTLDVLTSACEASQRRRSMPSRMVLKVPSPIVQNDINHILTFEFSDSEGWNKEAQDETDADRGTATFRGNSNGSKLTVQIIKAYTHQRSDELDVEEGDVVDIGDGPFHGWVFGKKRANNRSGWFPFNNTRLVKPAMMNNRRV